MTLNGDDDDDDDCAETEPDSSGRLATIHARYHTRRQRLVRVGWATPWGLGGGIYLHAERSAILPLARFLFFILPS